MAQSIQVKVLKNRNGSKGDALIDFYPMFNYFTDKDTSETVVNDIDNAWNPLPDDTDLPFI